MTQQAAMQRPLWKSAVQAVLPRKVETLLYAMRHAPRYPGQWTSFVNLEGVERFYRFSSTINRSEYRDRVRLMHAIADRDSRRIPEERGWAVFNFSESKAFQECLAAADAVSSTMNFTELAKQAKKPFLLTVPFDLKSADGQAIMRFAVDPAFVSVVSHYIGSAAVLSAAKIWYSPNEQLLEGRSQQYHLDNEDVRQLKVFIPIRDIDIDSGPMYAFPARESEAMLRDMFADGTAKRRTQKLTDEQLLSHAQGEGKPLLGKRGDVILVDTSRCYHYGSRPAPKPRLLLMLQYFSAFSTEMPVFRKRPSLADNVSLEEQVRNFVIGPFPTTYNNRNAPYVP